MQKREGSWKASCIYRHVEISQKTVNPKHMSIIYFSSSVTKYVNMRLCSIGDVFNYIFELKPFTNPNGLYPDCMQN